MSSICSECKCTQAEAMADALFLGLERELESGAYRCCEIVAWADEQWQAWTDVAIEEIEITQPNSEQIMSHSDTDVPIASA